LFGLPPGITGDVLYLGLGTIGNLIDRCVSMKDKIMKMVLRTNCKAKDEDMSWSGCWNKDYADCDCWRAGYMGSGFDIVEIVVSCCWVSRKQTSLCWAWLRY